jgi:NAD(P)-dependent dehydrogenase (short-subunit alcohol dehydrogenase family)
MRCRDFVMRGLDPRIHHLRKNLSKKMDGRVKPGHDASIWYGPGSAEQRKHAAPRPGHDAKQCAITSFERTQRRIGMTTENKKAALVTGAARGIGLAVAKKFLAEGWRVALLDIEGEMLRGAVAALDDADNMLALRCDVADAGAVAGAVAATQARFGRLDALVNNAGVAVFAPLLETSDEDWNRVLAVNLTGPFLCTKAAAPLMREHGGGAIVNITSISAVRASTLRTAYGTSKAGLAHLTKQFAVELAALGIRVNAVAPGPVETAMAKQVHTPQIRADYHDAIPLNRYGLEEELAEAVFFLCSERASYITGQVLAVDGGFEAAGIGLPTLRGERRNS